MFRIRRVVAPPPEVTTRSNMDLHRRMERLGRWGNGGHGWTDNSTIAITTIDDGSIVDVATQDVATVIVIARAHFAIVISVSAGRGTWVARRKLRGWRRLSTAAAARRTA